MTSGRFELDVYGRPHFRPNIPRVPPMDDVIDILLPASEMLRDFDRRLTALGLDGKSGRLFARLDAVHSSGAEGSTTTFTELMDFSVRPTSVPSPTEAEEITALANAVGEMMVKPADPVGAILQLHARLFERARDRFKAEGAGKFKTFANATADETQADGWFRYTLPASLPSALTDWQSFTMEQSLSVPELLRQACSHWMFEHIHPLQDGNGRVGRLLVPLISRWKNMTATASAFIGEATHEHKELYIEGLKSSRITGNMTPFARVFLGFIQQNAASNIVRIERLSALQTEWRRETASVRQDSAIHKMTTWIIGQPVFSVNSAAEALKISFATANEATRRLVALKIAEPEADKGRNRIFRVPAVLDIFDRFRKRSD